MKNRKEQENSFGEIKTQTNKTIKLQMTKPQKTKVLEGI